MSFEFQFSVEIIFSRGGCRKTLTISIEFHLQLANPNEPGHCANFRKICWNFPMVKIFTTTHIRHKGLILGFHFTLVSCCRLEASTLQIFGFFFTAALLEFVVTKGYHVVLFY